MRRRRTLRIIQQRYSGLAIVRGQTVDLFTCRQAATALGVSLKWMHRYVRRRPGILYQLGRPLLSREEVVHLQHWFAHRRMVSSPPQRSHPLHVNRQKR